MSYDELELDRLGDEKSALFFLISDTDTTYNFLVALAFSQMFNLLCERADNKYGAAFPTMYGCCGTRLPIQGRCRGWKKSWPLSGHGKSA